MGYSTYSPTKKLKYLSLSEFDELIDAIQKHDLSSRFQKRNLTIFLLAKYCALRVSEIGLIEFSDYNISDKTIFCRRLKGSVSNQLKIVDPLVSRMVDYFFMQRSSNPNHGKYIFASKTEKPIDRRTLDELMKYYCSFTSIPRDKWHFHALKHTRAMELMETDGFDVRDVQWWLGHKYIANTMIYLNYSIQAQKSLYTKLVNSMKR